MKLIFSLKAKITVVFVFLFILLILAAVPFYHMQLMKTNENAIRNYERLAMHVKKERLAEDKVIEYFQNLGFKKVENPEQILGSARKPMLAREGFELLSLNDSYFLHIRAPHFRVLFQDRTNKVQRSYIDLFVILFVVLLFIFIYYLIIKNINATEHQLKSRQLFLRTVMHELKTPIAKGRIISELIDDTKQKNRIITIFEKLNFLIDDFAKVEQIVSKNYNPTIYSHTLASTIEKAIEMLMLENSDNILCENISDKKINVDLDLFAMALKNLIDNGLKYSIDTKIIIKEEQHQLHFISLGDELKNPIHAYFKPFHNDTKLKNHGMGLGLYIVNTILQLHGMHLEYEYLEKRNIFKVVLKK
ncbi:HAMP domain-containing histidine kinase [bacterium]|nr:HAMP domain-containing histidine kinase [bacterium]MBU1989633.1 HAMP domain-containing histidine kinase [bacterium]